MIRAQAEAVLNRLNDLLDRRLNLTLEPVHKKEIMGEMNAILSGMISQSQKVQGEEITPKGLKQDENKT